MSFAPGVFSLRLVRRWRSWAAPLGSPRGLGRRRRRKGSQAPGPLCPHPSERRGGATQSPQALGCPGHLWGPGAEPGASSWGPEGAQGAGGAESGKCHQSSGRPACPAPPRRAGLLCRPCLGGSPSFPAVTPPPTGLLPSPHTSKAPAGLGPSRPQAAAPPRQPRAPPGPPRWPSAQCPPPESRTRSWLGREDHLESPALGTAPTPTRLARLTAHLGPQSPRPGPGRLSPLLRAPRALGRPAARAAPAWTACGPPPGRGPLPTEPAALAAPPARPAGPSAAGGEPHGPGGLGPAAAQPVPREARGDGAGRTPLPSGPVPALLAHPGDHGLGPNTCSRSWDP